MQHGTAPEHMDNGMSVDWESTRAWVHKATKEGLLAEIGVTAATLTILGWSVFALCKALENYQIVGLNLL